MKSLLIVYHSQSGSSARLAEAAWRGAAGEEGVTAQVLRAWDAGTLDLARSDGLLLVAAENSGYLSGGMKEFLDRTFYPAIDQGILLPYALIISAGNDGRGAAREAERILSGYPFSPAVETLILRGEVTAEYIARCTELGQALAAGLAMGIF